MSIKAKGPAKRRGFSGQSAGIRQLKGGPQQVAILENIFRNIEQMVDASFKNIAIPRFYKKLGGDDRKQGDTILYYLEHKWKKPMAKTPQQHYHRMVELLQIAKNLNKIQPTPNK